VANRLMKWRDPVWRLGAWLVFRCKVAHRRYRYDHGSFGGCKKCRTSWHVDAGGRRWFSASVELPEGLGR